MTEIITFGGAPVMSIEINDIEKEYQVCLKGGNDENVPLVFPSINKSLCSCNKININNIDITHFQIANIEEIGKEDYCSICQKIQLDTCTYCEIKESKNCPVIKSISCSHKFHYCCAQKWLSSNKICPLCAIDWKFIGPDENKMIIYFDDLVEEFDLAIIGYIILHNYANNFFSFLWFFPTAIVRTIELMAYPHKDINVFAPNNSRRGINQ